MTLPWVYLALNMSDSHICDLKLFEGLKCVSILPPCSNRVKSLLCAFNDYVSILGCSKKNKTSRMRSFFGSVKDLLGKVKYGRKNPAKNSL